VVDVLPWKPEGNYSHTLVENNFINGGYATNVSIHVRAYIVEADDLQYGNATLGMHNASAIIKIGIVSLLKSIVAPSDLSSGNWAEGMVQ